jgi:RNA polymerase subunit RPABC4/transcription elongation factor Spt4
MKYCYQCGRVTAGDPVFCIFCGRTYDVKLCPRSHVNSRASEVCSKCGSRDLSTPQPKVAWWWKALGALLRVTVGLLLALLSLAGVVGLLTIPQIQNGVICLAILLGILWWLWSELPSWTRNLARRFIKRKERRYED